jgi:hypothetical protein
MPDFNIDPSISLEEAVVVIQNSHQRALDRFKAEGFTEPSAPSMMTNAGLQLFQGQIPSDLTQLNDNQLGTLLGLLTEWSNFLSYREAAAQMELKLALETFDLVEAKLNALYMRDEENKRRTEAERKFAVRCDKRYVFAREQVHEKETYNTILEKIVGAATKSYAAVSRRITQRGQDIDRANRTMTVQNMPVPGQPMFRRP